MSQEHHVLEKQISAVKRWLKFSTTDVDSLFKTPIEAWTREQILSWAAFIKKQPSKREWVLEHLCQVIAGVARGIKIATGHFPRDTQYIALWLLLDAVRQEKGRLGGVPTGEGKTLILMMFSLVLLLMGETDNLITSNKVLAVRDSEEAKENILFFDLFGYHIANNCNSACEKDIDSRRTAYQAHVVYGDIGSYKRDFLLTTFLQNNIVGTRSKIHIIDEVDSIILDKLKEVLYLSHPISDLRHLLPIYIFIWIAVNASDTVEYTSENVQRIRDFVCSQIEKKEIIFPAFLHEFVNSRILIWIESAFYARDAVDGDSYNLKGTASDDIEREAKVVIFDKDTGVDMTSSHWSRGVHQFLQLKHLLQFDSETLKSVFVSTYDYLKNFRIYGLSGTVGTEIEKDFFVQSFKLDSFNIPSFKHRLFIDEGGFIVNTQEEWLSKIMNKATAWDKKKPRAAIIIVQTVKKVKAIVEHLKKNAQLSNLIFPYYSSTDKFVLGMSQDNPIKPEQIIVGTDVLGRGTDFFVSQAVLDAGGLCIISADGVGERGKIQRFGRAGRKGMPGSGVQIIFHPTPGVTFEAFQQEKTLEENAKIEQIRTKELQSNSAEYKLLSEKFVPLLDEIRKKLNILLGNPEQEKNQKYIEIQINSLKDHWAFWLDSVGEKIDNISPAIEKELEQEFSKFAEKMKELFDNNGDIRLVFSIHGLLSLVKFYIKYEAIDKADTCLDIIIRDDPAFSEAAYLYKTYLISLQKNYQSFDKRKEMRNWLKKSHAVMNTHQTTLSAQDTSLQAVGEIRQKKLAEGIFDSLFHKQVEGKLALYQAHTEAIVNIIGQEFTLEFLKNALLSLAKEKAEKIYEKLLSIDGLFKKIRVSKKAFIRSVDNSHSQEKPKIFVKKNDTGPESEIHFSVHNPMALDFFIKKMSGAADLNARIVDLDSLKKTVKTRRELWDNLKKHQLLIEAYTIIDADLTVEYLDLSSIFESKKDQDEIKQVLKGNKNKLFHPSIFGNYFSTDNGKKIFNRFKKYLIKNSILREAAFYTITASLEEINSLSLNFLEISKAQTLAILEVLRQKRNKIFTTTAFSLQFDKLKELFDFLKDKNIIKAIEKKHLLILKFDKKVDAIIDLPEEIKPFEAVLIDILKSYSGEGNSDIFIDETAINLPENQNEAYEALLHDLKRQGLIKFPKVNFSLRSAVDEGGGKTWLGKQKKKVSKELSKYFEEEGWPSQIIDANIKKIIQAVELSIGHLKFLPNFTVSWRPIEEYFSIGSYPPQIYQFRQDHLGQVIYFSLKLPFWDWSIFLIAMVGVLQIVAGVVLEVFTAGIASQLALPLIAMGVGDIIYALQAKLSNTPINWKEYAIQKALSAAFSLLFFGVGAVGSLIVAAEEVTVTIASQLTARQILGEITKRVLIHGTKAVALGVSGVAVQQFLQKLPDEIMFYFGTHLKGWVDSIPSLDAAMNKLSDAINELAKNSNSLTEAQQFLQETAQAMFEAKKESRLSSLAFQLSDELLGVASEIGLKLAGMPGQAIHIIAQCVGKSMNALKVAFLAKQHLEVFPQILNEITALVKHKAQELSTQEGKQQVTHDINELKKLCLDQGSEIKELFVKQLLIQVNERVLTPEIQTSLRGIIERGSKDLIKKACVHPLTFNRTQLKRQLGIDKELDIEELRNAAQQSIAFGRKPTSVKQHKGGKIKGKLKWGIRKVNDGNVRVINQADKMVSEYKQQHGKSNCATYRRGNSIRVEVRSEFRSTQMMSLFSSVLQASLTASKLVLAISVDKKVKTAEKRLAEIQQERADNRLSFFSTFRRNKMEGEEKQKQFDIKMRRQDLRTRANKAKHTLTSHQYRLYKVDVQQIHQKFLGFLMKMLGNTEQLHEKLKLTDLTEEAFNLLKTREFSAMTDVFLNLEGLIQDFPLAYQKILNDVLRDVESTFKAALDLELENSILSDWVSLGEQAAEEEKEVDDNLGFHLL